MKRIAWAITPPVAVAVVLAACGGGGKATSSPRAGSTANGTSAPAATSTPAGIASVVPPGWSVVQTWAAADGAYVAVESVVQEPRTKMPPAKSFAVYRRDDRGFLEVARVSMSPYNRDPIEVTPAAGALDADVSGHRKIAVAYGARPSFGESITIDAGGTVSIVASGPTGQSTAEPMVATPPPQPLATVEASRNSQSGSPTVTVGAPAGAVPVGWTLIDSAWSPDGRYVAVATAPPGGPGFVAQLSIYRVDGGALRELWREVNGFVRIDHDLAFRDVNGDGMPDVVYTTSSGGNGWTQSPTLALSIERDGTARDLAFNVPEWASAPAYAIDIDSDGMYEWAVVDASWELHGFCHACSPGSRTVLAWDGSAYVDARSRFGDWIVAHGQEPQLPADTSCRAQDAYMSQLVSRFLDYTNAHRGSDAARVLDTLSSFAWSPEFTAKRDAIVAALRLDPHHPGDIPDVSCQD